MKRVLAKDDEVIFASQHDDDDKNVILALSPREWRDKGCQESYVLQLFPGDWIPE